MSNIKVNKFTSFGDALSYSLRVKGLSNKEFSKKLGINNSQISHWLTNRNKPYPNTIKKLSTILGVSIEEVNNEWIVSQQIKPSTATGSGEEQELERAIQGKFAQYEAQLASGATSDADLDLIVSYALKETEALAESLKRLHNALVARLNKKNS